ANASSGTPYPTTPHSATPHPATPHPPSYQRTRAPPVYDTDLASGPARDAHPPPVEDQRMREPGPLVARHQPHQVPLDFHGIRLTCEAEQGGQALHVRVHHDPFVLPEPGAEYHARGLAAQRASGIVVRLLQPGDDPADAQAPRGEGLAAHAAARPGSRPGGHGGARNVPTAMAWRKHGIRLAAGTDRAPARNAPWPRHAGRAPWRARSRPWTGAPRSREPSRGAWGRRCRAGAGSGERYRPERSAAVARAGRIRPGCARPPVGSGQ